MLVWRVSLGQFIPQKEEWKIKRFHVFDILQIFLGNTWEWLYNSKCQLSEYLFVGNCKLLLNTRFHPAFLFSNWCNEKYLFQKVFFRGCTNFLVRLRLTRIRVISLNLIKTFWFLKALLWDIQGYVRLMRKISVW